VPKVRSEVGVTLVLAVLACSTEPVAPPPPPPAVQLRIDPSEAVLTAGNSLHFAAYLNGVEASVSWSIDDAAAGTITSSGTFAHNYCFAGPIFARARLRSDPTVSASSRIQIAYSEGAFVGLRSIQLSNGEPALVDSLAGTVRFVVGVEAKPYQCRAVRKLRMTRLVNLDSVTLDSLLFDPPLETLGQPVLSWQTNTVTNGRYTLFFVATRQDGSVETSSFQVNVRNP
jgi:hypothetical protein